METMYGDRSRPDVKLLLRLTKDQLLYKACEYRLVVDNHDKLSLAIAIANKEREMFNDSWNAISNRR
jgi:hypothetical protein